MPEVVLHNVPVRFPFEPYEVQQTYMTKVIQCLQTGENGILESPTGTGKTLCLLCSSLAWLETKKANYSTQCAMKQEPTNFTASLETQLASAVGQSWGEKMAPPKIIYSSRTHSQLSQAINELKRTSYTYMKVSVVGSRDQMCVHPEVSKETNNNTKVHMCQMRVKAKTCYYHNQVETKKDDPQLRQEVLDLEDLVRIGKKKVFCPYYMSRELKRDGDIIFMPYNYLLDPKTRKAHGVELQGNIVIFDEAHNVEKMCEEAASLQLSSTELALCIDEVTQVMKKFQDATDTAVAANDSSQALPEDFLPDDLYTLKALFLELEKAIDNIALPADGSGATFSGSFMFELLEKADITYGKKAVILELLDKLIQYLTASSASPFQRKGAGLQKFSDLIQIVFSKDNFSLQYMDFIKQCYKVHVRAEEPKKRPGGNQEGWNAPPKNNTLTSKTGRVICYWCFHPGFGMKSLIEQGAKCVILTSGTLSPLDSFTSELQVPFPIQLENPHIIQQHQVWVGTVCSGPDGFSLNSSFRNRSDPRYKKSLGQTILNFSRVIPDGLLVFFPSYTVLRDCQEEWQNSGVWSQISQRKPIFVEPRMKDEFLNAMEEFYQKINDPEFGGACFMAVCRGKVSEGLDFADRNGRAVIITGLPYPPFKDARVILKQKYLDEAYSKCKRGLTGQAWYNLEASRAVNQAIGRVIRHKDDYGAIILCDSRFAAGHFKSQLSAWVRPYIANYNAFGRVMKDVTQFFRQAQVLLPQPKTKKTEGKPVVTIQYEESRTSTVSPAAHGFQAGPSRPVASQTTKRVTEVVPADSNADSLSYLKYSATEDSGCSAKNNESVFSAIDKGVLTNQSRVSSRAACSAPLTAVPDYKTVRLNSKRRKIKLVPKTTEEPSCDDKQGGPGASDHVLKPLNQASGEAQGLGELSHLAPLPVNSAEPTFKKEDEKKQKLKSVGAYIKEVKSALTKDKYDQFSAAVKKYKKDCNYEGVEEVLTTLFSNVPQHHTLLKKFEHFLSREHQQRFRAACSKLIQD